MRVPVFFNNFQIILDKQGKLCDTSWMFVKDPERDFTRKRKLPLSAVISALLCMEGRSLTNELLRCFSCSQNIASKMGNNLLIQEIDKAGGVDFSRPILLGYSGISDALLRKYIEDSRPIT